MCQPSWSSARSNGPGMYHSQITRAWIAVAVIGSAIPRQTARCTAESASRRSSRGRPHSSAGRGRAATSSSAAGSMSNSCSIMWKVKLRSPASWSGETSAPVRISHPAA